MTQDIQNRARHLVLGALVADAAALGLHWLYDQDRIQQVAPSAPEFLDPKKENFDGYPAFFAHEGRKSGAQSQYGEQLLVMARALHANGGVYDANTYVDHFAAHFGYGGKYVGYIDHTTRGTLDNLRRSQDDAVNRAMRIPFDGDPAITAVMVIKAQALIKQHSGDTLREKFIEAARMTHDEDHLVAHGLAVLNDLIGADVALGAVDQQLPAISKLPALVAAQTLGGVDNDLSTQSVTSAVRTTNDHPQSVAYGAVCAAMMQSAIGGADIPTIVAQGRQAATPDIDTLFATVASMHDETNRAATLHFGMACDLDYGVPSVVHNLTTSGDFKTAIRNNIYAGGDSCGRGILLGALAGAVYGLGGPRGIPQDWIDQVAAASDVDRIMSDLINLSET